MLIYKDQNQFNIFNSKLNRLIANKGKLDSIHFDRELIQLFDEEIPEVVIQPNTELKELYPKYELIDNPKKNFETIDLNEIIGHNASSTRERIYTNISRVRDAIPYIVEGECEPIEIDKIEQYYYISNGKHRLYAHILLGEDRINAEVSEYNYDNLLESQTLLQMGDNHILLTSDKLDDSPLQMVFNENFNWHSKLSEDVIIRLKELNVRHVNINELKEDEKSKQKTSIWADLKKKFFD